MPLTIFLADWQWITKRISGDERLVFLFNHGNRHPGDTGADPSPWPEAPAA
jgi:hypothetical protein